MGQRTQTIINIHNKDGSITSMAYHNQRGYGRPLVTSIITAIDSYIRTEFEHELWHTKLRHELCRPYWLDEYFSYQPPYECNSVFDKKEHDNNDGRAIINMKWWSLPTRKLYNWNWLQMWMMEYIKKQWCQAYCNIDRIKWFNKKCKDLNIKNPKEKIEKFIPSTK